MVDKTLYKGLRLLETMAEASRPMRLSDIAQANELTTSNAYRLLQTLKAMGYVRQRADRPLYEITYKLFEVSTQIGQHQDMMKAAHRLLEALSEQFDENVLLSVRDGVSSVIVDRIESAKAVRSFTRIGSRAPLHVISPGKLLLAFAPDEIVAQCMAALKAYTERTVAVPEALAAELARIRRQGYAVADREFNVFVRGVAVPVRNRHGEVAAAVSISGTLERFDEDTIQTFLAALLTTRDRIEAAWFEGYRAPAAQAPTPAAPCSASLS